MSNKYLNIVFLVLLFTQIFLLILFIDNAYTGGWNLRQAQTAMMTRNIAEDGLNFLPTRLDFFAPYNGEVILEFPFLHSLTALLNNWLGESESNGRILVLVFHVFNVITIYKILLHMFKSFTAKTFAVIYSFTPIVFYSAHAFIPETTMLFFYLMAFYLFLLTKNRAGIFFYKTAFRATLSILPLIKPIGGVIYFPVLINSAIKGRNSFLREIILLGLCCIPFILWMTYAYFINNSDVSTGGDWANWSDILFGRGGIIGNWINPEFYTNVLFSLIFLNATPLIIVFSCLAIYKKIPFMERKFINVWALANIAVLLLFAGANRGHPYYQIYFVPIILIYAAAYFDHLIIRLKQKQIKKILFIIIASHILVSLLVFIYGVDENKRISNLQEFKNITNEHLKEMPKSPESFVIIQTENMTSGVYDYYLNKYTQQFSLKHHKYPLIHLDEQVVRGAKYLFMINSSYADTINISKSSDNYWEWLEKNATIRYESESMILFELN